MKLRRSLKIFFAFSVMAMGTITVLSYSTLAANYFEQGLDGGMRMTMLEIGHRAELLEGKPERMLGFQVARRWQDVQPEIRAEFSKPTEHLELLKHIDRSSWFSTPKRALFLMRYDQDRAETLYISRVVDDFTHPKFERDMPAGKWPHVIKLLSYGALGIVIFALCMMFLMQMVARPIERLWQWAKHLTPNQLNEPLPDFQYNELNRLADVVRSSLSTVEDSLRREQKFLAHASHELRTPIAVVRSNAELLAKLLDKPESLEKQKQVVERIVRAGVTMTDLTETLLWLNRGKESEPPLSEVNLQALIEQICQELHYLVRDKEVTVDVQLSAGQFLLPKTLCHIVLSNLIRNAYQHTLLGKVVITQRGSQVTIANHDHSGANAHDTLGFGLGLELTNRIIRHYAWPYHTIEHDHGRDVTINFRWQ
ncbi:HAMP domain-containing sensor histidine kinase [Vibrio furnissii]|uniref:sensor histidine kinase n=1 Tax=Vibrio furnissii TaxID=29494 RepID=UPI0024B87A03|nr:HAMP domain-containing sensor histidine kinase [Vibrio furnissii]WHR52340.1 HAMP domain-containing sensor histidine kinase [Vibrio furnissii]